ncbi:hypothetical protein KCP76_13790 [Salmonella enterica subsp. enterica serovar Weltevreden]|nr:hypothetical protein KCP76_13790 [Salmonella enterica subsp. enterica serovar Weltevreden]
MRKNIMPLKASRKATTAVFWWRRCRAELTNLEKPAEAAECGGQPTKAGVEIPACEDLGFYSAGDPTPHRLSAPVRCSTS